MNPLLEQFLAESRELLDHCSDTFLQLEKQAGNADILNRLFRYVHTIKGGSGLFDIAPFTNLVHVAEDSLSKARDGQLQISAEGIDIFLAVLDQLSCWLNELEADGALTHQASSQSQVLVQRIQSQILGQGQEPAAGGALAQHGQDSDAAQNSNGAQNSALNLTGLTASVRMALEQQQRALNSAAQLIVYRPEENAFFSGDDPLNFWAQVPGLIWQHIEYHDNVASLEQFDPYACKLSFIGLSTAAPAALEQALHYAWHSVSLQTVLPGGDSSATANGKPAALNHSAVLVLSAQLGVLEHLPQTTQAGANLASVQHVLSNLAGQYPQLAALPPLTLNAGQVNPACIAAIKHYVSAAAHDTAPISVNPPLSHPQLAGKGAPEPADSQTDTARADSPRPDTLRADAIRTIKVDQEKLEKLVDLAGELIVAKNSLQHLSRKVEQQYGIKALSRELKAEHAVLNRITESLQDVVMQIRMIPVSTIFQRFPRLVRDLSRRLGKEIELVVEGEETEADKNIVEQLADPLIHLVRNSIDHGIEMPQQRLAAGKRASGRIRLTAKNVQDAVQIKIHDDGAGIDPVRIKQKALAKGVISVEQAEKLSDQDALQLIFEPGFSTKEEVSELSGRGVGMDVVRSTVARLGGTIDLHSDVGKGSVISVTLPASITVSRVMMFELDQQVYGIPVEGLSETIKIRPEQIRRIKRGESYVLRNKLIPLHRMHKILGVKEARNQAELPILNLNINGMVAGFAVDKLLEGVDVIIKPLEGVMARFPLYSGAAVLGDGRVLLVINPKEMNLCH